MSEGSSAAASMRDNLADTISFCLSVTSAKFHTQSKADMSAIDESDQMVQGTSLAIAFQILSPELI
jgi:hypothetical protein